MEDIYQKYISEFKARNRAKTLTERVKAEKETLANENKERIIDMYVNHQYSFVDISKFLNIKRLTPETIRDYLKQWNISLRFQNGQHEAERFIKYVGVYDKDNELVKVFKYKWAVRQWLHEIGIVEAEFSPSQLNDYIRRNRELKGLYFKNISENVYEQYKEEE